MTGDSIVRGIRVEKRCGVLRYNGTEEESEGEEQGEADREKEDEVDD